MQRTAVHIMGSVSILGCVTLVAALANCSMAPTRQGPAIGSAVPDFTLKDYDGQEHSLASSKGKVVVLDFCSLECPYSKGVDQSLPQLASTYAEKGVVFFGIDSHKSTTPEQIKQYATDKKIPYPILKDEGNKYADAVGATRTPEFYIIDKSGKLVYHGAYDDRKVPEKAGDTNYVREALDAVLAGQPVQTAAVAAWGCTIKRK